MCLLVSSSVPPFSYGSFRSRLPVTRNPRRNRDGVSVPQRPRGGLKWEVFGTIVPRRDSLQCLGEEASLVGSRTSRAHRGRPEGYYTLHTLFSPCNYVYVCHLRLLDPTRVDVHRFTVHDSTVTDVGLRCPLPVSRSCVPVPDSGFPRLSASRTTTRTRRPRLTSWSGRDGVPASTRGIVKVTRGPDTRHPRRVLSVTLGDTGPPTSSTPQTQRTSRAEGV